MTLSAVRVLRPQEYEGDITALPTYDNTKLVAINTCPLWGIVRYTHHKTWQGVGRAMALEAGAAAHEVFAAHRLYSLMEFGTQFYGCDDIKLQSAVLETGHRIFGPTRYAEMLGAVDEREEYRSRCQQFALTALYNCGFYDDVGDKRRTTTNIEEMCIAYMDKYDWRDQLPYWDGDKFVGIEIPVDVVIELSDEHGVVTYVRFIGKADGVHWSNKEMTALRVHENKTASRLGDAWEMSWETNHQPTGYMIALSAILNKAITSAVMLGTCLPLPKAYTINGLSRIVVNRKSWQIQEWFEWLQHTNELHEAFKDRPLAAPMYTHSCNRYFRPCSFITLCGTEPEERQVMFDEMDVVEWNPLHVQGEVTDE